MKNTTNTNIIPVLPVHVEAAPAGLVAIMAEAANENALRTPSEKIVGDRPQVQQQQQEQYSAAHIRQMRMQACQL